MVKASELTSAQQELNIRYNRDDLIFRSGLTGDGTYFLFSTKEEGSYIVNKTSNTFVFYYSHQIEFGKEALSITGNELDFFAKVIDSLHCVTNGKLVAVRGEQGELLFEHEAANTTYSLEDLQSLKRALEPGTSVENGCLLLGGLCSKGHERD